MTSLDLAVRDQGDGVVRAQPLLARPGQADQGRARALGLQRQAIQRRLASGDRGWLQRQVLRRIADEEKLGEDGEVRAGCRRQREALRRQGFVRLNGAHGRVGLHRRKGETLGHARLLNGFRRGVSL